MFWRSQWIIICAHLVAQLSPQPLPRLILTGSPRNCSSWASNPHLDSMYALTMHPEGSDLIGAFFMSEGFVWKALFLSFVTSVVLKMWLLDMHLSPWLN